MAPPATSITRPPWRCAGADETRRRRGYTLEEADALARALRLHTIELPPSAEPSGGGDATPPSGPTPAEANLPDGE